MSQLSHAEGDSFTHESEDSVTATEGEWVRAHPSYTKIQLIRVVGFFITLVGVFAALTVMFEMMRSSGVLPKTTWLPALTGRSPLSWWCGVSGGWRCCRAAPERWVIVCAPTI